MGHCRGFGIQSPTDYRFVRYVINEHWPYYAYEGFVDDEDWLTRKLGRLYFRLANYRQPRVIIDRVGMETYLHAGCQSAKIAADDQHVEMALLPIDADYEALFGQCDDSSVVAFHHIYENKAQWQRIRKDARVRVSFDLYYCGIVFFDSKRCKQHYIVNF